MNLSGGTAEASIFDNGTALVEYTFADGSREVIPMIDANFDGRTSSTAQDSPRDGTQTEMPEAVNREVWILDVHVWNAGAE